LEPAGPRDTIAAAHRLGDERGVTPSVSKEGREAVLRRALIGAAALAVVLTWTGSALASASGVVISELRFRGPAGGNDEYVELTNAGPAAVDISGWKLQGCAAATGNASDRATVPAGVVLQVGEHYLFVNTNASGPYTGSVAGDQGYGVGFGENTGVRIVTAAAAVADGFGGAGVGGTQCREGVGISGMPTANGDSNSYERKLGGTLDNDNNAGDFAGPQAASQQNHGAANAAPSVTGTSPANNATDVPADTNLEITFSKDVSVVGTWFSIDCTTTGAHTASVTGGPRTFTLDPDADFAPAETCTVTVTAGAVHDTDTNDPPDTMAADFTFKVSTPAPPPRIHELQGAGHLSPRLGAVRNVEGIVTMKVSNGFFMQDPQPDGDPATSEGIFVFGSISAGLVTVGDLVKVNGTVVEFRAGGASSTNLTITEISGTSIAQVVSHGNALPPAVAWSPPTEVIDDDATGSVETSGTFDAATDGIDYAESLEGMLVRIDDATASGPSVNFGSSSTTEVSVVDASAGIRTPRGGIVIRANDFNPERLILQAPLGTLPDVNVGDRFPGSVVGALDYNFGNYKLRPAALPTVVSGGLQREITAAAGVDQLSVATFNVENLDPADGAAKFDALAQILVTNLRAPDVVALEEVQDNNGAVNDGTTDSNLTLDTLVAAIEAAGGPSYEYRYIAPVDGQDGGEPGGNIRVAFLFRTDRGLAFVDRAGAGSTTPNEVVGTGADAHLLYSPGRIDPASAAWDASRKPLAAELTYNGHRLFVIANHFASKGGDQPLYGRFQPPTRSSEVKRHQQAHEVADFVGTLLAADPQANVVVLGDLNDFQFSDTLGILETSGLRNLVDTLPVEERYTYDFDGNSQAIDHILLSGNPNDHSGFAYDAVHVNAEFANKASDHDPQVVLLGLPRPTIAATRNPAANAAGWNAGDVTVTFACVDPLAALLACPAAVTVSTEGAAQSVTGSSATKGGDTVSTTLGGISIDKTSPLVTYAGNRGTYGVDERVQITCTATDSPSGVATTTCSNVDTPAWRAGLGSHVLSATAADYAGNTGSATTTYVVTVTPASLCRLIVQLVNRPGVNAALCSRLEGRAFPPFVHALIARYGTSLTSAQVAALVRLAAEVQKK
jgi:predicted extracellular nuclease